MIHTVISNVRFYVSAHIVCHVRLYNSVHIVCHVRLYIGVHIVICHVRMLHKLCIYVAWVLRANYTDRATAACRRR
jgi:hypothetical protein